MTPTMIEAMSALIQMANSHVEDIESGISDGTYTASDNADLDAKRRAIKLMEDYVQSGASHELPIAIVDLSGGTIEQITSNVPMKVIFLDDDTEGGDPENVVSVCGTDSYVTIMESSHDNVGSCEVNPAFVQQVHHEITHFEAEEVGSA